MWPPKEKIVFVVDTIPVGSFPGRGFHRRPSARNGRFHQEGAGVGLGTPHPAQPGRPNSRLGTKKDAQDILAPMQDASAEMKKSAQDGKCWEPAEKDFKLPKYASWTGYDNGLPFVARRC